MKSNLRANRTFLILTSFWLSFFILQNLDSADGALDFMFRLTGINLEPIESDWGVDGFVKVYVGDECYGRSETITNNKNPRWRFVFKATFEPGWGQTLRIEVRHNNNNGADDALGDAYINLDSFTNPVTLWRDGSSRGQVRIEHDMEYVGEEGGKC